MKKYKISMILLVVLFLIGCQKTEVETNATVVPEKNLMEEIVLFESYLNGVLTVKSIETNEIKTLKVNISEFEDTMSFFLKGDRVIIAYSIDDELIKILITNPELTQEEVEEKIRNSIWNIDNKIELDNSKEATESLVSDESSLVLIVNGQKVSFDVQPHRINGTLMIPLRYTMEAMGFMTRWHQDTNSVDVLKDETFIRVVIKENNYRYNEGMPTELSVAPYVIDGRTLVPIDFFTIFLKEYMN